MNHLDSRIGDLDVTLVSETKQPEGIVVLCHGFGADRADLSSIADEMIKVDGRFEQLLFVFPDGPLNVDELVGFKARAWWLADLDRIEKLYEEGDFEELKSSCPTELKTCSKMIGKLIGDVHESYNVDYSKILVGGFSQGAMLATDVALGFEHCLGGLIAWSGSLICEDAWRAKAGKHKFPVYQSHGTMDPILPFSNAVELCNLFADAGLNNVFTEFDGPHTIDVGAMKGAMKLIRKVCF